jgi:hypothetical protein
LGTANLLNPPPDAASAPSPTNDVLIAEMNRQREVTARVMSEAGKLAQSYGELQGVLAEMKNVARTSALLSQRFATNESRIIELERGVQKLSVLPPTLTNDVPAFSSGPKDAPKP